MSIKIIYPDDPDDWGPDPKTRKHDSLGAELGAAEVKMRANSQKAKLLVAFAEAGTPLIADEAGSRAGINIYAASHWTRCSELADLGLLEDTGTVRKSERTNSAQRVYVITQAGRARARILQGH